MDIRKTLSSIESSIVPNLVNPNETLLLKVMILISTQLIDIMDIMQKENPGKIIVQEKNVTIAGTAERLPNVKIPYGHEATILAKSTNGGTIYLGGSKLEAEDRTRGYPLVASGTKAYKVKNLNEIWADATISGNGIIYTTVQEIRNVSE